MMKPLKFVLLTLATLPLILGLGSVFLPDIGLIFLFIENIIYLPLSWIGSPFFDYITDIGGYLPTILGRILSICFYLLLYYGVYRFEKKITSNGVNK